MAKTPVANLVRNAASPAYYGRLRVGGKLIWKSLKTDRLSVAKMRLGEFLKEQRQGASAGMAVARGKMTFEDALQTYRERPNGDLSLKERSKTYREERIAALLKSWPELSDTDVARISKADCLAWAARFGETAAPSNFNNTAGTVRMIFDIAIEAGALYNNPAMHIKRKRVLQKVLHLPSQDEFSELIATVRKSDGAWGAEVRRFHRVSRLQRLQKGRGRARGRPALRFRQGRNRHPGRPRHRHQELGSPPRSHDSRHAPLA